MTSPRAAVTASPAVIYRCPRCGLFFGVSAGLCAGARGIGCTECPKRVAYVRADVAKTKTKKESKA